MAIKKSGLKWDLMQAKVKAAQDVGIKPPDIKRDSYLEREAHYTSRAIIKALREANFTITQLKAPVVVEELVTPSQPVNVKLDTLLGEYQPILKVLRKIGGPIPGINKVITVSSQHFDNQSFENNTCCISISLEDISLLQKK